MGAKSQGQSLHAEGMRMEMAEQSYMHILVVPGLSAQTQNMAKRPCLRLNGTTSKPEM